MGQIIDKTINQPPFGPKCEDDCEAKPYDKKGKMCYKGECVNVCPANAYIRKDGKCACEDGYKYLEQQLPGQDKLKGDGWGHCKEEKTKDKTKVKTKVKKKVKKDKKVKPGTRLEVDLERKPQEDNKLLDFLEEQLKKNPNLTEDDLERMFNPEPQKPIIKTVIERPEPIVRTIIERPDPIIKTVVQTVIRTPEPVVSDCVYGNRGRHSQINDGCPGKEGPNKNIRWDTIKKRWYDMKNETYVETDFIKEMRVPTVIPPMNGGTCYEDGKKDKIEPCSIDGVERPIDGVWGSWKTERIDGNITTIDTVNSNWSNEVNGEQQNINFGKEGQECITEESLLKGTNPIQVFKREPTIVPKYGGKRLEGPSVKRKPYMYDETKKEFTKYCPINAAFTKDWKNIDWNEEKCSEGYTEKQLLNESTKKFERDSNLPGYTEEERKNEDRIIGPGDRTIYRYKTRKVKRISKYGGIPVGKWHSSTGDVPKEKYDYRLKGYDECPGVREAIEKIKSNDTEWRNLNLVTVEPKDCKPVFTWNKKWYKPFEKDTNGEIIDTTSIREIKVRPGIGNEQARGLDSINDPKQVLNYASNTVKKRGKFIFSSVKNSNATINSDGSWEPTQDRKGEWIQMETDDGNIQVITGVITQGDHVKNSWVKKFEVKVSRNGQSWSNLIENDEGETEFIGNTDRSTEKDNKFKTPIEARYIRIYPTEWNNTTSMRTGYIKKGDNSITCYGGSGLLGDSKPEALLVFDKQATMDKGYYHQGSGVKCPSDGEKFVYNDGFSNFSKYKESNINIKDGDSIVKAYKILDRNVLNQCGTDETHGGWSTPWDTCLKPLESGLAPNKNKDTGEYDEEQIATCREENGYQYKYRKWNSDGKGDGFKNKNDDKTYRDNTEPYAGDFNIMRKSCKREHKCVLIPDLDGKLILRTHKEEVTVRGNTYYSLKIIPDYKGVILNIKRSEELIEPSKFVDNVYKIDMQAAIKDGEEYTIETLFNYELVDKANEILGEEYDIENWTINNYEIRMIEGPNDDPRINNEEEQKKNAVDGSAGWSSIPSMKMVYDTNKGYYGQIERIEVPSDYDYRTGTACEDMGYSETPFEYLKFYPHSTYGHALQTGLEKDSPKYAIKVNMVDGLHYSDNYYKDTEINDIFKKEKEKEEYKKKANREINAKFETEEKKIRDEIAKRDKNVAEQEAKGCICQYNISSGNFCKWVGPARDRYKGCTSAGATECRFNKFHWPTSMVCSDEQTTRDGQAVRFTKRKLDEEKRRQEKIIRKLREKGKYKEAELEQTKFDKEYADLKKKLETNTPLAELAKKEDEAGLIDLKKEIEEEYHKPLKEKIGLEHEKRKFIFCSWNSFVTNTPVVVKENIAKFRLDTNTILEKYKEPFESINIEINSGEKPRKYKKDSFVNIPRYLFGKTEHFGNLCVNIEENMYKTRTGVKRKWSNDMRRSWYVNTYKQESCKDIGKIKTTDITKKCSESNGDKYCQASDCCEPYPSLPKNEVTYGNCSDYTCPDKGFIKKLLTGDECKAKTCTEEECCHKLQNEYPKSKNFKSICLPSYECEVIPVGVILQKSINDKGIQEWFKWKKEHRAKHVAQKNELGIKFWEDIGKNLSHYKEADKSKFTTYQEHAKLVKEHYIQEYEAVCKTEKNPLGDNYKSCSHKQAWDERETKNILNRFKQEIKRNFNKTSKAKSISAARAEYSKYIEANINKAFGKRMPKHAKKAQADSGAKKQETDLEEEWDKYMDKQAKDDRKKKGWQKWADREARKKSTPSSVLKKYNDYVKELKSKLDKLEEDYDLPPMFEHDMTPNEIIIKAGKNTNGDIKWSDEIITLEMYRIQNRAFQKWSLGEHFTILFHPDVRQAWKGHEHIWLSPICRKDYRSRLGFRVNLLYGIEGYGKSLEKKL